MNEYGVYNNFKLFRFLLGTFFIERNVTFENYIETFKMFSYISK